MASELEDLNPKSNSQQPQQREDEDCSTKENRPRPKPDESSPAAKQQSISAVNIDGLEKKFAPFVRTDVYGTMGRGKLSWTEKILLGIAFLTLLPIRVAVALATLAFYYLICRVCTMFLAPKREDEQEDYAHVGGWRRAVIVHSGRFLSRFLLFVLGFYWIKETYCNPDIDGKLNPETEGKDLSEEPGRPGVIISNHVSYLDILYHVSSSFTSFVAERSVLKLPLFGFISKCLGCVYVQREMKSSDFKGVSGVVSVRIQDAHQNKLSPMMMIFPGVCS